MLRICSESERIGSEDAAASVLQHRLSRKSSSPPPGLSSGCARPTFILTFLADMRFRQVEHEHSPPISHPAAARILIWTICGFCAAESNHQRDSWKQVLYFRVCFGLLFFALDVRPRSAGANAKRSAKHSPRRHKGSGC